MKILLVSRGVFPVPVKHGAGAEAHMYNLANEIANLGHEVHYVTNVSSDKGFHKNIVLHKIQSAKILANKSFYAWTFCHASGNIKSSKKALEVLKNESFSFDIIHNHGNLSTLLLSHVKKGIPLIYTVHDAPPYSCRYDSLKETVIRHMVFQCIDSGAWRNADHLITVSENLKGEILKKQIPEEKISVIYNGVDSQFLGEDSYRTSSNALQNKYGLANHYCLYVGRLAPRKGLDYLLHALKKTTNIQCVIVGDGPQREYLLSLRENLGLRERVIFTGYVPKKDLRHLYATADFFVLPSLAEGLPLVILEALASGTPVIASNVAGNSEIVLEGYNGLMVPPRDVEALSKSMRMLTNDVGLREKMSENAKRTVGERFSWKNVAKEVLRVYEKVCD